MVVASCRNSRYGFTCLDSEPCSRKGAVPSGVGDDLGVGKEPFEFVEAFFFLHKRGPHDSASH